MAKCFRFTVVTAEGIVMECDAGYCRIPEPFGSVGILADHAPMLCAVREGEILVRMENGTEKTVRVLAGVAEVRENTVTVLTDRASVSE